jgi:hypothetical protein
MRKKQVYVDVMNTLQQFKILVLVYGGKISTFQMDLANVVEIKPSRL